MKSRLLIGLVLAYTIVLGGCETAGYVGRGPGRVPAIAFEAPIIVRSAVIRGISPFSIPIGIVGRTVKMGQFDLGKPELFLETAKGNLSVARVLDSRTIRTSAGQVIEFPGELYSVKGDALNVRQGPGVTYSVITIVRAGDVLLILRKEGGWFYINNLNGNILGYVHHRFIAPISNNKDASCEFTDFNKKWGIPRQAFVDFNDDGISEETWADKKGDGTWDYVLLCLDGKRFSEGKLDKDNDGKFDTRWIDYNNNGYPDPGESSDIVLEPVLGPIKIVLDDY